MTVDKGLDGVIADKIGEYVGLKGKGWEVLERLKGDEKLMAVKSAKEGLADMELLFGYLDVMGVLDKVSLDIGKRSATANER